MMELRCYEIFKKEINIQLLKSRAGSGSVLISKNFWLNYGQKVFILA